MILQIPESVIPVVVIVVIVLAVVLLTAGVYLLKRKARKGTVSRIRDTPERPKSRLDYHSESQMTKKLLRSRRNVVKRGAPPQLPVETGGLTKGKENITESFAALARKYSIEGIIIAAPDGLVFASSGLLGAASDAALYSDRFFHDPLTETPGYHLFGLSFEGQDLVGIIRTGKSIPDQIVKKIASDTKDILNWWI